MKFVVTAAAILATIGAAVPSLAAPAPQRDWYILSAATNSCVSSKKMGYSNPQQFHLALRAEGVEDVVKVNKSDTGDVDFVTIAQPTPSGSTSTVYFFPSEPACELALTTFQVIGVLPNNSDLK